MTIDSSSADSIALVTTISEIRFLARACARDKEAALDATTFLFLLPIFTHVRDRYRMAKTRTLRLGEERRLWFIVRRIEPDPTGARPQFT